MLFSSKRQHELLFKLSLAACVLAVSVVVLGAFTRLVHAGLGCPDWPGCYGHLLWPNDSEEIAQANTAYPDMPVDTEKTWPEMVHRYLAGSLGLFILVITIACDHTSDPAAFIYQGWCAGRTVAKAPVL